MLQSIAAADRVTHFKTMSKVMHALYVALSSTIDKMVLKMVLKTHKTNGQGR